MKKRILLPLVMLAAIFSSCSTYQYSARQVDVRKRNIDTKEQMAGVVVDYNRQVSATSDYQMSRKDAIAEAEFICIRDSKVDVVVDPIVKVEYNPFKMKNRFKATIVGYAGTYKQEETLLDASKHYTREEIENYKLLNDPNFPQYFYNHSVEGDNYYFNTKGVDKEAKPASLMFNNPVLPPFMIANNTPWDYQRSIKLRNAGIGTMVTGAVLCLVLGVPLFVCGVDENEDMAIAGSVFMGIGACSAVVVGVPMITVGAVRANKARKMDITLNSGPNGIGLGLTL